MSMQYYAFEMKCHLKDQSTETEEEWYESQSRINSITLNNMI